MNKAERSIVFLSISIIFGVTVALQFKSTLYARNLIDSNALNADRLVGQLAAEQKAVDELKAVIGDNISRREIFIKEYIERNMDFETAEEWDKAKLKAGFTDVRGPGITMKLDDAAVRQEDSDLNWLIIHDQDIKIILNELKKSGAQAIAINGERVVPMSEQVCAGPTIKVNDNRYSVPYIIEAIGDPELLYENLANCAQVAEMLEFKIRIEIQKLKEIKINKFSGIDDVDRLISGLEEFEK